MNVFDYLTADMEVTGTIPNIPKKAKVLIFKDEVQNYFVIFHFKIL